MSGSKSGGATTGIPTQILQFDIVSGVNPTDSRINLQHNHREPGGVSGVGGTTSQLSMINMSPSPSPF